DTHNRFGTRILGMGNRQSEIDARLQPDFTVYEARDTNLGSLEIAHYGNIAPVLSRHLSNQGSPPLVLIGGTMRKIQSGNIKSGYDKRFDNLGRAASGPECGYNLRTTSDHQKTPHRTGSQTTLQPPEG